MSYRSKYTGVQIEGLLDKIDNMTKIVYKGDYNPGSAPYTKGDMVLLNDMMFIAKKQTSEPPIPLYKTDDDTFVMLEENLYVHYSNWEDGGNKEDWICLTDDNPNLFIL